MRRHAAQKLLGHFTKRRCSPADALIHSHTSLPNPSTARLTSCGSGRETWSLLIASTATAAALASLGFVTDEQSSAYCAAEIPLPSANPKGQHFLDDFTAWLNKNGCDLGATSIRPCKENSAAGLGVFATDPGLSERLHRSWWRRPLDWVFGSQDAVLAKFPLTGVVTAKTIVNDKKLGSHYQRLLDEGFSERQLIAVFLLVERTRGPDSAWQAWISMLPQTFGTPLFFGQADADELRGTTIHDATRVLKADLKEQWRELSPHVEQLLRSGGGAAVQGMSATFEDFLWAFSVFWSRSISFPEPTACPDPTSGAAQAQEGIVPGLDFCNHSPDARSRWSVWNPAAWKGQKRPDSVAIVTSKSNAWADGAEVTLDYGEKSNEMLLLQYGFTLDSNSEDAVMILCPQKQEGERPGAAGIFPLKLQLLEWCRRQPQMFLTAEGLANSPRLGSLRQRLGISEEFWETLEVLVMDADTTINACKSLEQLGSEAASKVRLCLTGLSPAEAAKSNLEKLALLEGLIRRKLSALEAGTGTLEKDVRLLEAADFSSSPVLRHCIVYRASQKRIARGYLARVKKALLAEEEILQTLQRGNKSKGT